MNAIKTCVVSTKLTEPQRNHTTAIDQEPIDTVRDLKQRPGAGIVQYGSARYPRAHCPGLLDELHIDVLSCVPSTGRFDTPPDPYC